MKRYIILSLVLLGFSLTQPRQVWALINQPTVQAEGTGTRTASVLWDVPTEAGTGGDKTVASWELGIADNFSFSNVTTLTYGADTLAASLTKDNGIKSLTQYYVRVRAVYTDATDSNYGTTYFYSGIPKIKNLRVADKTATAATLKWGKTVRHGNELQYDVKLYRKSNLVLDDSVFGLNHLAVTDLRPGKKYYFKVRGRQDTKYGIGKWSAKKYFTTLAS